MQRANWRFLAVALIALLAVGCQKDRKGTASLSVRTTLPGRIPISLVSVDRPGNYVDRVETDFGGMVNFVGVKPGRYMLVYQFSAPTNIPGRTPYNYGESEVVTVVPGRNIVDWSVDTGSVTRTDDKKT